MRVLYGLRFTLSIVCALFSIHPSCVSKHRQDRALLGRASPFCAPLGMQSTLPAVLEPHRTYLDRAHELAGPHPLVALQCRLMCLQLAMAARSDRRDLSELAACELRQWVVTTLEECEAARARLGATAADPEAALAALRALGLELIARASHSDRPDVHPSPALEWTVQEAPLVAKCFHAGAVLLGQSEPACSGLQRLTPKTHRPACWLGLPSGPKRRVPRR